MNIKINLLSIFIIVGFTFSNISEAQFKNPLSALGGDSESSGGDICGMYICWFLKFLHSKSSNNLIRKNLF